MKISASYWMFEGGLEAQKPITEAMTEAKNLGYDAIELCIASSGVLTHEATQAQSHSREASFDEEPDRNEGRNYADEHYCHHERSRYDPRS